MHNRKIFVLILIGFMLFFLPNQVFAHEVEEQISNTSNFWLYGLIGSIIISIIFILLNLMSTVKARKLNAKKQEDRNKLQSLKRRQKLYKWSIVIFLLFSVIFMFMVNQNTKENEVSFSHIHGLGYTNDGQELLVAAHDGLRIYHEGHWYNPSDREKHDYMGFSIYKDGFYSSGHPAINSDLKNPFGVIKSSDQGKNFEIVDLYGEVDFHGMTVGYETEDIFVFNPHENSRMNEPGFYYSSDKTVSWNKSSLEGFQGQASSLAAHPTEKGVVAIGATEGIFLSTNYGDDFEKIGNLGPVSAVTFGFDNTLMVGVQSESAKIVKINLETNQVNELPFPSLTDDAIAYIHQNPTNTNELAVATQNADIYLSQDGGTTWEENVDEGKVLNK
jgi:hypothetical protein